MNELHRLLDHNLQLPPEYHDGLSNHLPMALHALHSLGAGGDRLRDYFSRYVTRFEGRTGLPAAFAALRAGFDAALARDGEDAVLRRVLPDLLPGVAAAAFHGVIRTAHAVQAGHRGELAAALAYWAWRHQPLAAPPAGEPMAFDDWAAALIDSAPAFRLEAPLISLRMQQADSSVPYLALAGRLAPGPDTLARLAGLAVERYTASRNFTVLHMVTGLRAVRVLMPWVDDSAAAGAVLVRAFTAAYLAARVGPAASAGSNPVHAGGWPAVTAAAIASDDDHVIKLVEACRAEAAVYGVGRYLQAAALAVS